ncbi:MAG: methyltransferase domain-containing protein, partial [Gammaproteobacteria bacterium]
MSSNLEPELVLPWTGERFVPTLEGKSALEHIHRYVLAKEFVHGKRVLDIASGEGYGSHFLAEVAQSVIGVDIARDVVSHANQRYKKPGLEFRVGQCASIPLQDASVDVVVSFETIEHHHHHDAMMTEIKRVLRPNGLLIISSPDKHEFSDVPGTTNPFHVKELYREEFERLLHSYFKNINLLGQRVVHGSSISSLNTHAEGNFKTYHGNLNQIHKQSGVARAEFFIALASDGDLPHIDPSVYSEKMELSETAHLAKIKRIDEHNKHLTATIDIIDTQNKYLNETIENISADNKHLHATINDMNARIKHLNETIERMDTENKALNTTNQDMDAHIKHLNETIEKMDTENKALNTTNQDMDAH